MLKHFALVLFALAVPHVASAADEDRQAGQQAEQVASDEEQLPEPQAAVTRAQSADRPHFPIRGRFGIDPRLFQFGTHVFFADSTNPPKDGATEVDAFPKGQLGVDLQFAGVDFVHYVAGGDLRYGVNLGFGPTVHNEFAVMILTVSFFTEFAEAFTLDAGVAWARSSDPSLDSGLRDRRACFIGISFPTKINDLFRR